MGFKEKVFETLVAKYGTVTDGIYKGTQVVLADDPNKKKGLQSTATLKFDQIAFYDGPDEKGRHDIDKDIKSVSIASASENGLNVIVLFHNDEHSSFVLEWEQEDNSVKGIFKQFLTGKLNQSEDAKRESKYRNIKVFVRSVYTKLSLDSVNFLQSFYREKNIMDDLSKKLFDTLKKIYNKRES